VFRAGDSMSFARAVSQTYGLIPVERENAILLSGFPESQSAPGANAGSPNSE
jgi:hypothetical protein